MAQKFLSVKNFERYQHYKDRNPAWVKLYWDLLSDEKFVMLNMEQRGLHCHLILLASRHDNYIPFDMDYICLQLKLRTEPDLTPLFNSGFLLARCKRAASKSLEVRYQNALSEKEKEKEKEKEREEEKEEEKSSSATGKPPRTPRTAEEYIAELKANPAYAHVDFALEFGRMSAWLALPRNRFRKMSSQFILNWVNKIDKPLAGGTAQAAVPPMPGPDDPIGRSLWRKAYGPRTV